MSRAAFGTGSPAEMAGQQSGIANIIGAAFKGLKDLSQRAVGASEQLRTEGTYNPAPAFEAAQLAMGGPLVGTGVKAGEAVLGSGPIRTFHSSPHDFERFDLSKLRTGQGANTYGSGTYLAESPAVSGQGGEYWKEFARKFQGTEAEAMRALQGANFDRSQAIEQLARQISGYYPDSTLHRSLSEAKGMLESGKPVGPRTYEVNINAQPEQFLQWDKPIANQPVWDRLHPDVRNSIDEALDARGSNPMSDVPNDYTGRELYQALKHPDVHEALPAELPGSSWFTGSTDEAQHTMAYLKSLDIPGIRYADARTRHLLDSLKSAERRGTPEDSIRLARLQGQPQTYNYVVNEPNILDIRKKYAAPAAGVGLGAGLANSVMSQPPAEQGM
jgi:hypothetical protein